MKLYVNNFASFNISSSFAVDYVTQVGTNASASFLNAPTVTTFNYAVGNQSTLTGAGAISGQLTNDGGNVVVNNNTDFNGIGSLTVVNYNQSVNGSLYLEIFSLSVYDVLSITGNSYIAGNVYVNSFVAPDSNNAPAIVQYPHIC